MAMSDGRASVELVWELAIQEALAGRALEVGPEHFFCAITKFAELPLNELGKVPGIGNMQTVLAEEQNEIRRRLKDRNLDGKSLRRKLRALMPAGKEKPGDRELHRSEASRSLFEQAARRAKDSAESLGACHLLDELLAHPTLPLASLLMEKPQAAQSVVPPGVRVIPPSVLDGAVDPRAKVLSEALKGDPSAIHLFCETGVEVTRILAAAAGILGTNRPGIFQLDADGEGFAGTLHASAELAPCAVLLDLTRHPSDVAVKLVEGLPHFKGLVPVVALKPETSERLRFAGSARVIWMHDLKSTTLPSKL
jgi:hypothetical protein